MEIDLEGNKQEYGKKYGMPQDSYKAVIVGVSEPYMAKAYTEGDEDEEKLRIDFEVDTDSQKVIEFEGDIKQKVEIERVPLSMFIRAKISKGSGKYSNSALYDVIAMLGLHDSLVADMDKLKTDSKYDTVKFAAWLRTKATGKEVKVMVKNSKNGISRVSEINRLLSKEDKVIEETV